MRVNKYTKSPDSSRQRKELTCNAENRQSILLCSSVFCLRYRMDGIRSPRSSMQVLRICPSEAHEQALGRQAQEQRKRVQ
jgi:hypothetical protein